MAQQGAACLVVGSICSGSAGVFRAAGQSCGCVAHAQAQALGKVFALGRVLQLRKKSPKS